MMIGLELRSLISRVVNGGNGTIDKGCWWERWGGMNINVSENWIVITGDDKSRGYYRV